MFFTKKAGKFAENSLHASRTFPKNGQNAGSCRQERRRTERPCLLALSPTGGAHFDGRTYPRRISQLDR